MNAQKIKSFNLIGISVKTTNENNQAARDISALWSKFISQNILQKIPNKIDNTIYCVYTDYEKDHTKPYTTILGCKVENLKNIPIGMVGKTIEGGNYIKQAAKGNLMQGAIANAWIKIWGANFSRLYTNDFEVYGQKAQNPENAEVDIFIAVK